MAETVIAVGTNIGQKAENLRQAISFLSEIKVTILAKSAIYETEPIGSATEPFLNGAILLKTKFSPLHLLEHLKFFEKKAGRDMTAPRWSNRVLDYDIITYNQGVTELNSVTIPHSEYSKRLFVLHPLYNVLPNWKDPISGKGILEMIEQAPKMGIFKTDLKW